MHEALCRSSGTTLDILHVERRAADHSANIGSNRVLRGASNYLIYTVLWSVWRVIFGVKSNFLPALREMPGGGRSSASHALGASRDVVKRQCHRDHRVIAHQTDDIGDPDMAERFERTVVKPFCDPARIS